RESGGRARVLEGARRGVADNPRATLLGAQDRQHPEQDAKEPTQQGQARVAGDLDGRDQEGCPFGIRRLRLPRFSGRFVSLQSTSWSWRPACRLRRLSVS